MLLKINSDLKTIANIGCSFHMTRCDKDFEPHSLALQR